MVSASAGPLARLPLLQRAGGEGKGQAGRADGSDGLVLTADRLAWLWWVQTRGGGEEVPEEGRVGLAAWLTDLPGSRV